MKRNVLIVLVLCCFATVCGCRNNDSRSQVRVFTLLGPSEMERIRGGEDPTPTLSCQQCLSFGGTVITVIECGHYIEKTPTPDPSIPTPTPPSGSPTSTPTATPTLSTLCAPQPQRGDNPAHDCIVNSVYLGARCVPKPTNTPTPTGQAGGCGSAPVPKCPLTFDEESPFLEQKVYWFDDPESSICKDIYGTVSTMMDPVYTCHSNDCNPQRAAFFFCALAGVTGCTNGHPRDGSWTRETRCKCP